VTAMAGNAACKTFIPMLSPFIDGELSTKDRTIVERHLAACRDCTGRAADLRAEAGLVRVGLDMAADEVDFTGFSQKVLAQLTPYKPPLLERLRVSLSEIFLYRRGTMVYAMVATTLVLAVGVPLLSRLMAVGEHPAGLGHRPDLVSVDVGPDQNEVIFGTDEHGNVVVLMGEARERELQRRRKDAGVYREEDEEENVRPASPVNPERPPGVEL
jgi:hypothetical protein